MYRKFLFGALVIFEAVVLLCIASSYARSADDPWGEYRAVCKLYLQNYRGKVWQGSGTLIATDGDKGLILSCRHVNPTVGAGVRVVWPGAGSVHTIGKVIYVQPGAGGMRRFRDRLHIPPGRGFDSDLALVVADFPESVNPVPVGRLDVENRPFRSVGYGGGDFVEQIETDGYVVGNRLILDSPYMKGMSGGPVFDKHGRVVAVVVATDGYIGMSCNGQLLHSMIDAFRK